MAMSSGGGDGEVAPMLEGEEQCEEANDERPPALEREEGDGEPIPAAPASLGLALAEKEQASFVFNSRNLHFARYLLALSLRQILQTHVFLDRKL